MSLIKSGAQRGNRYLHTAKPTEAATKCFATDCSTNVQVPVPYCMDDCVGAVICKRKGACSGACARV
jgi:hypothetical protein